MLKFPVLKRITRRISQLQTDLAAEKQVSTDKVTQISDELAKEKETSKANLISQQAAAEKQRSELVQRVNESHRQQEQELRKELQELLDINGWVKKRGDKKKAWQNRLLRFERDASIRTRGLLR